MDLDNSDIPNPDRRYLLPSESGKLAASRSAAARSLIADERQRRVLVLAAAGLNKYEIARQVGVNERTIRRDLIEHAGALKDVSIILESLDLDAGDILRTLTGMHDADLADLYHDRDRCPPGCACHKDESLIAQLRPIKDWPVIWRRGLAGEVKVEPAMVRSRDGSNESWDKVGDKITVKVLDRLKVLELAMRHKAVDAMAAQKQDVSSTVHVEISERQRAALSRGRAALERIDAPAPGDTTTGSGLPAAPEPSAVIDAQVVDSTRND